MLTNTVVSFKMAKHGSISFTCVEFIPLNCLALQRMEHLDADAVLSPAGFQCPEISWPKTDVALRPGCRVPEVYLSAGAES